MRPRLARADPLRRHVGRDGREGTRGRRRARRRRSDRRPPGVLLRPGRRLRRWVARRAARQHDRPRARAGRQAARSRGRVRVLGRRADAGGRGRARRLWPHLPPHREAVRARSAGLDRHRPVGRRWRVLAGADRLGGDDRAVEHVPDRPRRGARGDGRGRDRAGARRHTGARAKRRVSFRGPDRRERRLSDARAARLPAAAPRLRSAGAPGAAAAGLRPVRSGAG